MKKITSITSFFLSLMLVFCCLSFIPIKANAEIKIDNENKRLYSSTPGITAKAFAEETGSTFEVADDYIVRTGTQAVLDNVSYTVIVMGDCAPDGKVDSTDIITLKRHILGIKILSEEAAEAVSLSGGKAPGTTDYVLLKRFIIGITQSLNVPVRIMHRMHKWKKHTAALPFLQLTANFQDRAAFSLSVLPVLIK